MGAALDEIWSVGMVNLDAGVLMPTGSIEGRYIESHGGLDGSNGVNGIL
jgi:hypothetical protein